MGQNTAITTFSPGFRLDAAVNPDKALLRALPVTLGPNVVAAKGTLLVPGSLTPANDVQTIAWTGSPTGGTITLKGTNPVTGALFETAAITYATSTTGDTNIQTALNAALTNGATVAVSSLGITFGGTAAGMPVVPLTLGTNALTGGTTPSITITHTTTGAAAGAHSVYAGSGSPTCWLMYDVATDNVGNHTLGGQSGGGYWGQSYPNVPAYFAGEFYGADLPNLDTNAVTKLSAHFIAGSLGVAGAILSVS